MIADDPSQWREPNERKPSMLLTLSEIYAGIYEERASVLALAERLRSAGGKPGFGTRSALFLLAVEADNYDAATFLREARRNSPELARPPEVPEAPEECDGRLSYEERVKAVNKLPALLSYGHAATFWMKARRTTIDLPPDGA